MIIVDTNITIMVKDMKKSIDFYQSISFTVKNRWADFYAQLTAPGITIGLHPISDNGNINSSDNISIGFIADNFEEAKSLLNKLNIKTQPRQEEGGEFIHFNDPDGTALYFIKPKW